MTINSYVSDFANSNTEGYEDKAGNASICNRRDLNGIGLFAQGWNLIPSSVLHMHLESYLSIFAAFAETKVILWKAKDHPPPTQFPRKNPEFSSPGLYSDSGNG